MSNYIQGYPGIMPNLDSRLAQPKPFLVLWPGLMPRSLVSQTVHIKGKTFTVDESMPITPFSELPKQPSYDPISPVSLPQFGPTVRAPLGHVVYARSGDKGPNVNISMFCSGRNGQEAFAKWEWLKNFLSAAMLRRLLGHDAVRVQKIERCEFPNLRAVHFVLHGILGSGVGSTAVLDSLGKVSFF